MAPAMAKAGLRDPKAQSNKDGAEDSGDNG